jgi:hypothetical protein
MEVPVCPKCNSRDLQQHSVHDAVLHRSSSLCTCKECGYKGLPTQIEEYEGIFQGLKPPVPGFIGPWGIMTKLSDGDTKILLMFWEDARDCVTRLHLRKGTRIRVILESRLWKVENLEEDEETSIEG